MQHGQLALCGLKDAKVAELGVGLNDRQGRDDAREKRPELTSHEDVAEEHDGLDQVARERHRDDVA
ncbi:MAG: hypothetical protein Q8L14_35590 [Myxococcales bacterium]|nr:hypothetical protein [Myxococcales bacterium]